MGPPYQSLTITHIQQEIPGVKTFVFGGEDAKEILYEAGQYLTLVVKRGGQEIRRSYSITSAPALGEPLSIGVKRIENGILSRLLVDNAKVGEQVVTTGAAGFFTLPPDLEQQERQVFFWAAGSGITPIFSLLKTVLFNSSRTTAVLVYSNRSVEETIFKKKLDSLAEQFPDRLQLRYLFSTHPRLDQARLHKDLLQKLVLEYARVPVSQLVCFVCGPENYRRLCIYGLRELQVPLANIRQESFNSIKMALRVEPPDTAPHKVTLTYQHQVYQLQVQYPDTILQSARKANLYLPYSCEAGKCGSCVALCTKGEVWMAYNEVLTEREVTRGLTLTCVGYPVGGEVMLEIK